MKRKGKKERERLIDLNSHPKFIIYHKSENVFFCRNNQNNNIIIFIIMGAKYLKKSRKIKLF